MNKSTISRASVTQLLALGLLFAGANISSAAYTGDKDKILTVIKTYERALNGNDVEGVLRLYSEDGVFMPQNSSSHVGKVAVRTAYENVFKAIDLDINFTILEIESISSTWAYARTTSSGVTIVNATGDKVPASNQELFLFRKDTNGQWKIARYIFSTTAPKAAH